MGSPLVNFHKIEGKQREVGSDFICVRVSTCMYLDEFLSNLYNVEAPISFSNADVVQVYQSH